MSSELIQKFTTDGLKLQTGSHKIFMHPKKDFIISVPSHGSKEVATGTAKKLLKRAGLK
jgi:predicted RNA binding protein YcfA (HicA-like mRNA interferase family)